jgi:hypothetical protein
MPLIKKCLIVRAMLPERFPEAFDQLMAALRRNATRGRSKKGGCTCQPPCGKLSPELIEKHRDNLPEGIIPQPTPEQAKALTDRVERTGDALLMKEFLHLFKVPK